MTNSERYLQRAPALIQRHAWNAGVRIDNFAQLDASDRVHHHPAQTKQSEGARYPLAATGFKPSRY